MLTSQKRLLFVGLALSIFIPSASPAHAQPSVDPFGVSGRPSTWNVVLGAGGAMRPTFEGSDRYFVTPFPMVSVTYRDMISLDVSGLNAYWRHEGLQIGGGLTYNLGRTTSNGGVFAQGDERLSGLGDIPAALGLRGFVNYRLGPVMLGTTVTKFLADGNDGTLVDASIGIPYKIGDRTMVNGRVFATWADQNYMQTYFGVTPGQALTSNYAIYEASSGIKNFGLSVGINHRLTANWLVMANATVTQLTGYAQGSPLTVSDTNASFLATIGYRF